MNILIAGGPGTFLNNILIKCHKEGHKVSVLTGNRFTDKSEYQKCFEVYSFPYDAGCLNEIFESAAPDVTIFMGEYDTNFAWENEEADSVKYTGALANVLMSYAMRGKGRFIYMSGQDVYGKGGHGNIEIEQTPAPDGFRTQAIHQGEALCENYRVNRGLDIMTVRLDHLYCMPSVREDVLDIVSKMCLECLESKEIHYNKNSYISCLYERDAVEALHSLIKCNTHQSPLYQISSEQEISEESLAAIVRDKMDPECTLTMVPSDKEKHVVLSGIVYESEFGKLYINDLEKTIQRIAENMKKNSYVFLTGEDARLPLRQRIKEKGGWFIKTAIPFVENILAAAICYFLHSFAVGSTYFGKLDIFLLYVLLFAAIFGQQQATVSALLAVVGFFLTETLTRTGFEILLDGNTYVWVAQLFIVGLSVGYMRDQIHKLKDEQEEEKEFLEQQIEDIQDINSTNARVKDVLETQLVNQSDSLGKIYKITSSLEQYSPEEVLFYSAETVGKIMKTEDVAIYMVSNADYARLFSSTSKKARELGNSIRYTELGELYETLRDKKVYINRKMDNRYPLMANAIFRDGSMAIIIMVWGLSWENMTLGQSNQLVVVSSLIQNAMLRSNTYLEALVDKRYMEGTRALSAEGLEPLVQAFLNARDKGLNNCTLLHFGMPQGGKDALMEALNSKLRLSDYFGVGSDGEWYGLLSNTEESAASMVVNRFIEMHVPCEIAKGIGEFND